MRKVEEEAVHKMDEEEKTVAAGVDKDGERGLMMGMSREGDMVFV